MDVSPPGDRWSVVLVLFLVALSSNGGVATSPHSSQDVPRHSGVPAPPTLAPGGALLVPSGTASAYAWSNVSVVGGPNPPARSYAAMAYDTPAHELVLFGGLSATSALPLADTWTYSSGVWTNLTGSLTTAPAARSGAAMTYDPTSGGVILFGGMDAAGDFVNDTWEFQSGAWTNVTPVGTPSPPRLYLPTLSDDTTDSLVLLAGGDRLGGYGLSATWTWSTGKWTNVSATAGTPPSPRFDDVMSNDPADSGVLLFGGFNGNTTVMNDTWLFRAGGWTNLTPTLAHSPPRLLFPSLGEVGPAGALLLTEGAYVENGLVPTLSPYTWQWNSSTWTNLTGGQAPLHPPPLRTNAASAEVNVGEYLAVFGGVGASSARSDLEFLHPVLLPSATLSPLLLSVNGSVDYSGSYTGGVPPVTEGWTFGDGGTSSISSGSYVYTSVGTFTASFWVKDGFGDRAYVNFSVAVVGRLTVEGEAAPSPVDPGIPVNFTSEVAGGAAPYTYFWRFGNGTGSSTLADPSFAYPVAGVYTANLTVNDSHGSTVWLNLSILVVNAPKVQIVAPTGAESGQPVQLYASFTGGVAPFTYAWNLGDGTTSTSSDPDPVYAGAGSFHVSLVVHDVFHLSAEANATLNITAPPPPLTVKVTASPTSGTVSSTSFEFMATISGGYAPYAYTWRASDGAPGTGSTWKHAFGSVGSFEVWVNVSDPWSQWANGSVNVSVQASSASSSTTFGSLSSGDLEVLVLVVVVAVAVLVALLLARRRSRGQARPSVPSSAAKGQEPPADPEKEGPAPGDEPGAGNGGGPGGPAQAPEQD